MIIRSARKETNFYILDKSISEDTRLSWQARGLLVYLLGKPDDWAVSVQNLIKQTHGAAKKTGRSGIYSILKELESAGYVNKIPVRSDSGEYAGMDYVVNESPRVDYPYLAEPYTANTTLLSNDIKQGMNNTNTSSNDAADVNDTARKTYSKIDLVNMGVDEQTAADWLLIRKQKKMPLTETAIKKMGTEAEKAGISICEAITLCAENSWGGFKADYIKDRKEFKPLPDVPYDSIKSLYDTICHDLNPVIYFTSERMEAINKIWLLDSRHQEIDFWEWYFSKIASSEFLTGKSTDFRAGYDWIMTEENFIKIIEGTYDERV